MQYSVYTKYHIVAKFGGKYIWQIYFCRTFGKTNLTNEYIIQKVINRKY